MMWWLTQHLITTTALAMAVAIVVRWRRLGPAIKHALWLVVVVKFITPPLVVWPWTPWPPIAAAETSAAVTTSDDRDRDLHLSTQMAAAPADMRPSVTSVEPPPQSLFPSLTTVAVVVWCSGGGVLFLWRALQAFRLWRRIRRGRRATGEMADHVANAAAIMGIEPPRTRLVRDLAAPGIWSWFRPLLLWPQLLSPSISTAAVHYVVLHELAHIRRRDHVTAWLVQIGDIVWWWNPLYWLVRRELHENAEMACDAWVTALAPGSRREYAETLLKFSQIVPAALSPRPAVSFRTDAKKTFTRRLMMIMDDERQRHCVSRWTYAVLGIVCLATLPAWSRGEEGQADSTTPAAVQPNNVAQTSEPLIVHVDQEGGIHMNDEATAYMASLKTNKTINNRTDPTRELFVWVDLDADNNTVVKIVQDFGELGFTRELMTVRRVKHRSRKGDPTVSIRVYAVEDLVVPFHTRAIVEKAKKLGHENPNQFLKPDEIQTQMDQLIELITTTVSPNSWDRVGGVGSVFGSKNGLTLIIRQTANVHADIAALFEQMRSLRLEAAQNVLNYLNNPSTNSRVLSEGQAWAAILPPSSNAVSPDRPPAKATSQPQLVTRVYAVADLLYDLPPEYDQAIKDDGFKKITDAIKRDNPSFVVNYDSLLKLIVSKTGHDDWDEIGGRGTISKYDATCSLVIRQTDEDHREIEDLLSAMREKKLGRAFVAGDRAAIEEFAKNYRRPPH